MKTPDWVAAGLQRAHKPKKNGVLEQDPLVYRWVPQQEKTCSWCDRTVWQDQVHSRRAFTPRAHWRSKCMNCKLYWNSSTLQFDIDPRNANYHIAANLRDK